MAIQENVINEAIISEYKSDALKLITYLPWFESKRGQKISGYYEGEPGVKTIPLPTYEPTLLRFIKEVQNSSFYYKNYPYIYTKNHIKTPNDERICIEQAKIRDIDDLKGILSRYVLEGMSHSSRWVEAVDEDIFLLLLKKLEQLFGNIVNI